jgi:hypothetical protein
MRLRHKWTMCRRQFMASLRVWWDRMHSL